LFLFVFYSSGGQDMMFSVKECFELMLLVLVYEKDNIFGIN